MEEVTYTYRENPTDDGYNIERTGSDGSVVYIPIDGSNLDYQNYLLHKSGGVFIPNIPAPTDEVQEESE